MQDRRRRLTRARLPGLAVLLCVAAALAAPASQALTGWGIDQRQFSAQGDSTLRVAPYAFSIWGLIYAGLLAYAVRRVVQGRGGAAERAVDAPLAAASLGCGLWIVAAGLNQLWLTVIVIVASLAAALAGLARLKRVAPAPPIVAWPIAGLAGWLTAAAMVNILTVLTAKGLIAPAAAQTAALAGIAAASLLALAVLWSTRFSSYALPAAWGLVGAYVAERDGQPIVALSALGCAVVLLVVAMAVFLTSSRGARIDSPSLR